MSPASNRRDFLKTTTALGAGLYVSGLAIAQESDSPNEKLNVGLIGPGGRGGSNLAGVAATGENIVALCDVDERRSAQAVSEFPEAHFYSDFRKMLDDENLDAVVVSTPDHTHAYCSVTAMRQGLHCYCEKPLTRTVQEMPPGFADGQGIPRRDPDGDSDPCGRELPSGGGDHSIGCDRSGAGSSLCGLARVGAERVGRMRPSRFPARSIGTCGWGHPHTVRTTRLTCRANGGGGGTLAAGRWETWGVTTWTCRSGRSIYGIQ